MALVIAGEKTVDAEQIAASLKVSGFFFDPISLMIWTLFVVLIPSFLLAVEFLFLLVFLVCAKHTAFSLVILEIAQLLYNAQRLFSSKKLNKFILLLVSGGFLCCIFI